MAQRPGSGTPRDPRQGSRDPARQAPRRTQSRKPQQRKPIPRYRPVGLPEPRRGIGLPAIIAIVIASSAAAAYVVTHQGDKPVGPPYSSAKGAPAGPAISAPTVPPVQKGLPPPPPRPVVAVPEPPKPPPQAGAPRPGAAAIPVDFLKELEEYKARSGSKAIALAVDASGGWAYGAVAGLGKQASANEEALFDCEKQREGASVQATCRLFAIDDKIVW